jgi:hypothetical protein
LSFFFSHEKMCFNDRMKHAMTNSSPAQLGQRLTLASNAPEPLISRGSTRPELGPKTSKLFQENIH